MVTTQLADEVPVYMQSTRGKKWTQFVLGLTPRMALITKRLAELTSPRSGGVRPTRRVLLLTLAQQVQRLVRIDVRSRETRLLKKLCRNPHQP